MKSFHLALIPALLLALPAPASNPPGAHAQDGTTPVSVRAVDERGQTPAETLLALLPVESSYEEGSRWLAKQRPPIVDRVRAKGPEPARLQAPVPGLYWLSANTPRGRRATRGLVVHLHEKLREPALKPREALEIRVVDATGQPVDGALVVSHQPPPETERRSRRTNGEGRATIHRDLGVDVRISAAAPGLAPSEVATPTRAFEPDRGVTELRLRPGIERRIEVRDRRDRPVPEALIRVGDLEVPIAETGEDGRGTVWIPREGEALRVVVETAARRAEALVARPGPEDDEGPVVLRLSDPHEIAGLVRHARSREPMAKALVWLASAGGGPPLALGRTDEAGRYVLRLAAVPEAGRLHAAAPGYLVGRSPWNVGRIPPTLTLEPAATVFGRVVDTQDQPVAGVEVVLGRQRAVPTSADGRFRVAGVEPGLALNLVATAPGFAPETVGLPPLEPGQAHGEVHLVLELGRTGFGRVLGPGDEPVAGARVTLHPSAGDDLPSWRRRPGPTGGRGAGHPLQAATDAGGRFEIPDLPAGSYRIAVKASGFAPAVIPGVEVAGEARSVDLGTIFLDPGVHLEGRVTDPTGAPLEAARVAVQLQEGPLAGVLDAGVVEPRMAVTDAEGRFEIPDLAPQQRLELRVSKNGYAAKTVEGLRAPAEEPVEIVLQPGGRVEGVVVDADGAPVRDARVSVGELMRLSMGRKLVRPHHPSGLASTGEDGRFVVSDLPTGELALGATKKGYLPSQIHQLEIEPGAVPEDVRVVLERGATVTGRVLGPDGAPLPRASVRHVGSLSLDGRAQTDGDGRFRLEAVPLGPGSLEADHESFSRVVRDVEVEPGEQVVDFQLERGRSLSGRVVDENGAPIPEAEVGLRGEGDSWIEATDPGGGFRFQGLEPGSYRLRADAPGKAETELPRPVVISQTDVSGVEIRLTSGVVLQGRVSGLDPDALAQTHVAALRADESSQVSTRPSWDGSFRFEDVEPGDWRVLAMAGEGRIVTEEVTVGPAGAEVELVFDEGLVVTGRILRNGEPVTGATVGLQGQQGSSLGMTTTDARGAFRLEGLEPGPHEMMVIHELQPVHREEIDLAGDREILVELSGVPVLGRVVDAQTGAPLDDVTVELRRTGLGAGGGSGMGGPGTQVTDASGAFRFDEVGPGDHRLAAFRSGYGAESRTVTVSADVAPEPLEIALEPADRVHLLVGTAAGAVPRQVHVAALDASGNPVFQGSFPTGEGGRVRMDRLPEGTWELRLAAPGTASASVSVRVPGPDVPVTLPSAASLRVLLPDLEGGLGQTRVRVLGPGGALYRAVRYDGGLQQEWRVFGDAGRVDDLAPGVWTVEATLPDGRTLSQPVRLTPGGLTTLTLE